MKISEDERKAWHPDVDVYFQTNAWADTAFSVEWANKTLKPFVKDLSRYVLLCDNLTAQTSDQFLDTIAGINKGVVWFGLKNATDLWQQVDAGYAQLLKVLVDQAHHKWLDSDENAERWYGNGNEPKFTAKERRILITQWCGEAYKKLCQPTYDAFRLQLWRKTGGLLTADGSDDGLVKPEGLADYEVPPPLEYLEPTPVPPSSNATDGPNEEQVEEDEEVEEEEEPNESEEAVDEETDRMYDYGFVGMRIKALYPSGWFVGNIKHYNPVLNEYQVEYEQDNSIDHIRPEDIDGVEVMLLS